MSKISLVAHVPVISRAYLDFFKDAEPFVDEALVLENTFTNQIDGIRKDVRRLDAHEVVDMMRTRITTPLDVIGATALSEIVYDKGIKLWLPDDEVSQFIIDLHGLEESRVILNSVFLRWDRTNINTDTDLNPDHTIADDELPEVVLQVLQNEVESSVDWWRQVGCVFFEENEVLVSSHNKYVPREDEAEIVGDIRSQAYRGVGIEIANAQHAEAASIALAAREGISLNGSRCLVSTFPCPSCAKLIVDSGIKEVIYVEGYAVSDAEHILKKSGVTIVKIEDLNLDYPRARTIPILYQSSSEKS